MEKNRKISKERIQSRIFATILIIFLLFAITTIYYFVAMYFSKQQGGLNIYISAILAGISGGLWGLGINISYNHYHWAKYCREEEWIKRWKNQKTFRDYLHGLIAKIITILVIIIVTWLYIDMIKLY